MQVDRYEELIGKRLLHSVLDSKGVMLIPVGTIILPNHVEKLQNFRIELFDIHVEKAEQELPVAAPAAKAVPAEASPLQIVQMSTEQLIARTEVQMRRIYDSVVKYGEVPVSDIEDNVLPFIMEASSKRNVYQLFSELKSKGDFRYKHSVGVAVIATMIGKWLQLDDNELTLLATAASLYDIGYAKLPPFLFDKSTWFQPHEYEIVKTHAAMGYELIKQAGLEHRIALVALQHHEREDGSGYPAKLKGSELDKLSKIVALADVYLAMMSERPYRPAHAFYQVVQELYTNVLQQKFDSAIGMTFLNRLMSSQVGSDVILSDERRGKIVLVNANYPTCPLVSLVDGFLDLSKTSAVKIKEIVG